MIYSYTHTHIDDCYSFTLLCRILIDLYLLDLILVELSSTCIIIITIHRL